MFMSAKHATVEEREGKFVLTEYVPTDEKSGPRFPLLLTTGRILSQYNVGAQTRRTANTVWHEEDRLEIHPHDAENRGISEGDWVRLASRAGETTLSVRRVWAPTLYCDRMRPVVSSSGKRGPVFSSVATYSVRMNLPLPRTKPPMCMIGVPSGAFSLHGHCTEPIFSR